MAFIITMAMCLPTQERGPQPKGWKKRLGTCQDSGGGQISARWCLWSRTRARTTYRLLKVVQAELCGFGEEFRLVHETDVEDDVGPIPDLNAVDGVVLQSFSHSEIHHGVKPHGLVDEALHHLQALMIDDLLTFVTWQ